MVIIIRAAKAQYGSEVTNLYAIKHRKRFPFLNF